MVDMLKLIHKFNCLNSPRNLHHLPTFHYYPPYDCRRRSQRGVRVWSLRSNTINLKIEQSQRLMRAKLGIAREQSELKGNIRLVNTVQLQHPKQLLFLTVSFSQTFCPVHCVKYLKDRDHSSIIYYSTLKLLPTPYENCSLLRTDVVPQENDLYIFLRKILVTV